MILYFSGTGNSLYTAQKLADEDEKIISISEQMVQDSISISLEKGEALGIVFPVYFYTLPLIVRNFLEKAEIQNADYVYSVITCGGGTGQASAVLKKLLQKKNITLSYFKEILMPDNAMLFYQIPSVEQAGERISNAEHIISNIKTEVAERKKTTIKNHTLISDILGIGYKKCSSTKKYYAEDSCIGCGICQRYCPEQVIKIENKKPVWTKENCSKCASCINRCPKQAIQYGKHTKNRNRYVNPFV